MATPAEQLAYAQGVIQPVYLAESITRGELATILNTAASDAAKLVETNLARGTVSGTIRAKQLQAASEGLGSLSSSMWGQVGAATRAGVYNAAELAVNQQIDREYLMGMPFNAIRQYEEQMFFNAYQSAEDIISRKTNGFALADRIYRNGQATVMQVGKIVDRGLALQQSAREIARQVRGHFRPDVPGGSSYAAMRLARTEINNAHHDTTKRLTEDQPWVLGYKWNLSSSHPKPDACNQYAEDDHDDLGPGVYKKGNAPSKPHPQCLCYLSIFQEDRELFQAKLVNGAYDDRLRGMGVRC